MESISVYFELFNTMFLLLLSLLSIAFLVIAIFVAIFKKKADEMIVWLVMAFILGFYSDFGFIKRDVKEIRKALTEPKQEVIKDGGMPE